MSNTDSGGAGGAYQEADFEDTRAEATGNGVGSGGGGGGKQITEISLVSSEEEASNSSPPAFDENSNSNSNSQTANNAGSSNGGGGGGGGGGSNKILLGVQKDNMYNQPTSEASTSRIGTEYQAVTVNLVENLDDRSKVQTKEDLVWAPSDKLSPEEFDEYLHQACYKHSYNIEQALSLLFWHKFDLKRVYHDLEVYVPTPVVWTKEEQILFEHAFTFHGKNFSKIRQVLPDKKQSDLVNYYYMWKKTRSYTSLIDQQQQNNKSSANGNGNDSLDNSLREDADDAEENFENMTKICLNCDLITNDLQSTPRGMLCNPCYNYWKHTGLMKPDHLTHFAVGGDEAASASVNGTKPAQNGVGGGVDGSQLTNGGDSATGNKAADSSSSTKVNSQKMLHKSLRKLPKGIYLNCEELLNLAKSDSEQYFDSLNVRLKLKKEEVQRNKQLITEWLFKLSNDNRLEVALDNEILEMEEKLMPAPNWTPREIGLVLQGFSKYGDNFKAISEVIRTKTEGSIQAFYEYNKEFLSLDKFMVPITAKDLKVKTERLIENVSKATHPSAPKMADEATSASSTNEAEAKGIADVVKAGSGDEVIVIDDDEATGKSQEPAAKPVAISAAIEESEDAIFISNDSN